MSRKSCRHAGGVSKPGRRLALPWLRRALVRRFPFQVSLEDQADVIGQRALDDAVDEYRTIQAASARPDKP
jgi:hypothetical protein